jgi:uncharacterized caspase-like protein
VSRLAALVACSVIAFGATAQTRDRSLTIQPSGKPTEARHALVIGNSSYTVGPLKNPVNDARAMAKALGAAGFNVRVVEDATHIGMQRAVRQWGDDIAKGGVGLFYYAGHGLQVKGKNYLVPVNAEIDREDEIDFSTLDVNFVLAKMDSAKNMLNIVILDACRNNPFARSFRSASRGLAQMDAPTGTFIAFATAPGSVASDGTGENGLYTQYLLREMQKPGLPIEQMFKQVRNNVMRDTKDQQIPWESSSMRGDFAFRAGAPVAAVAAPVAVAAAAPSVSLADMEKMIQAALDKQRAMLEAQGLKVQQAAPPPPPKLAGPDPREKEIRAAQEKAAAERAAAEKMLAEAKVASEKAAAERVAAQKAAADLAIAEKAATERAAAAKIASTKAAAEQAAAKLATERAAAERIAAQKAAAELNAAADRATAERAAMEKQQLQLASAAPLSVASAAGGRMPQQGDTWTYRLNEPSRTSGPKQRAFVATVQAVSGGSVPGLRWAASSSTNRIAWAPSSATRAPKSSARRSSRSPPEPSRRRK